MDTAQVVIEDGRQVVHLPEGVHIEGDEIAVKQVGRSLLLVPRDTEPWRLLVDSLDEFTDDYMHDRAQPVGDRREALFD